MAVNILLKRSATASKRPTGASMAFGELNLNYDAATGGLFYKDSAGNVVKVGPCQVSSTAPNASPAGSSGNSAGEFWFDTSTQTLKLYDGTSWVEAGGMVQGVTGTAPITVDNTDPLNPVIGIDSASTTARGAVQLNDTTSSSSTTEALTANQGRILQTQIDALVISNNLTFAGTIDATTGNMVTVSTEGASHGFAIGDPLPSAAAGNSEFFVIVTVPGTMTPPGGSAQECHQGDWWLSDGTVWNFLDVGYNAPYATTSVPGIVQLATDAEVQAGVNSDHVVVPSSLQSKLSDSVSTTSSTAIASSTAAKTAYDAGIQGQTDAAAAQATANAALPKAGGTMTGNITFQDAGEGVVFNGGSSIYAISDSTSTTSSTTAASSTAVKSAYDLAAAALPKAGGVITGDVTVSTSLFTVDASAAAVFQGSVDFNGAATFYTSPAWDIGVEIGPAGQVTYDNTVSGLAATNVQDAIDEVDGIADAAMPKTGGIFTGNVTVDAASVFTAEGVTYFQSENFFQSGSTVNLESGSNTNFQGYSAFYPTSLTEFVNGSTITGTITIDGASVINSNAVSNFDNQLNLLAGGTASFATGSTTTVDGSFTFNTAPTFPAGVDIGAAAQVTYDNATSGLAATNVQTAIDEIVAEYVPNASFAAAGDLLVGTGAGTYSALSAGAADYILQSNGDGTLSWVANSSGDVTSVSGSAPITVDNTDPQNPIVGIDAATTSAPGAVQLYNNVDSTSITEAATANAVKIAYDAAIAAAGAGDISGIASATVLFVNSTAGNDSTGERGTTKAYLTITAALADAQNGDTIFLSPGSFTENVTLTKGVNMVGTYNEQGMGEGTSIVGNFVFDMVTPAATANPTLNHIRFVSPNTSNAFKVLNNSFGAGGIATINDCAFVQAGDNSTTEFCFETAGTWTRSLYVRRATFDGNVKHAAGTAAGASGYLVLDNILATGSATRHYNITSGTVEFRRPSNSLSPVLQTGGVVLFTDCISGISPSNATTSPIFGGTNISYKGSAASVGTGTVYFNGYAPISGAIQIGANLIYGWSALNVTPANLTISGSAVAYTTAVPAAAAVVTASQQRPRFDLLTTTSSVAAANQLATVVDSANGTVYTVAALDAGTF